MNCGGGWTRRAGRSRRRRDESRAPARLADGPSGTAGWMPATPPAERRSDARGAEGAPSRADLHQQPAGHASSGSRRSDQSPVPRQWPSVVGIDLGTTNSLVAHVINGRPTVIRDESGDGLLPSIVSVDAARHGLRRPGGRAPTPDRPVSHRLLRETVHGTRRRGRRGRERRSSPSPSRRSRAASSRIGLGERTFTPPEISAFILKELKRRAEAFFAQLGRDRPRRGPGGDHRAGLLQRRAAHGHPRRRAGSRASRCCASSTSRPRRRSPTVSTGGARGPSPSTTSAAAPSTSPSCASRTASSRCSPPTATPISAATTSTSCWSSMVLER